MKLDNYWCFFQDEVTPQMYSSGALIIDDPSMIEILFSFGLTILIIYMVSSAFQTFISKKQMQEE